MRFLIMLLSVVIAVLAFLMENRWLYVVAAVLILAALVMLATQLWHARKKAQKPYASARSREDELSALGIVEIRPKEKKTRKPPPPSSATEKPLSGREQKPSARPARGHAPAVQDEKPSSAGKAQKSEKTQKPPDRAATPVETPSRPAKHRNGVQAASAQPDTMPLPAEAQPSFLTSYLRAVQAALGAHTVCLLVQEDLALEYRIEGVVGSHGHRPKGAVFSTPKPLLTANMSHQAATLAEVGPGGVPKACLGYYAEEAPAVRQIALAPVPRSDEAATCFLLADTLEDGFAEPRRTRTLLPRFADLLARVLDARAADEKTPALPLSETKRTDEAEPGESPQEPPLRRQIVAEEMEKARADEQELALALVYLNRAEVLAEQGGAAVEVAEEELQTRLREAAPQARVERFGELTYGIFRREPMTEVERWAVRLQNELADATGALEGGVSIGLAMLRQRHESPEAFRKDATDALREAYTSGTCTILE